MVPDGGCPNAAVKQSVKSAGTNRPRIWSPRRPVCLPQPGKLLLAVQNMADQLPVLQVLAGMDWDAREGVEARRGAEEGVVSLRDKDAARVRVEAREDGVVEGRVRGLSVARSMVLLRRGGHGGRETQEEGGREKHDDQFPVIRSLPLCCWYRGMATHCTYISLESPSPTICRYDGHFHEPGRRPRRRG